MNDDAARDPRPTRAHDVDETAEARRRTMTQEPEAREGDEVVDWAGPDPRHGDEATG